MVKKKKGTVILDDKTVEVDVFKTTLKKEPTPKTKKQGQQKRQN